MHMIFSKCVWESTKPYGILSIEKIIWGDNENTTVLLDKDVCFV